VPRQVLRSYDPHAIFGSPPLLVEDRAGIYLWSPRDVARIRPERFGRVEVTRVDGTVMHRPAPAPRLERSVAAVAEIPLPGTGLCLHDVLWIEGTAARRCLFHTDAGTVPFKRSPADAARLHPAFVAAGLARYVNMRRLRAVRRDYPKYLLVLDSGDVFPLYRNASEHVKSALGVPSLQQLEPRTPEADALFNEGLRDWPVDLLDATADRLREWFGVDERRLIANCIWQARNDFPGQSGTDHRRIRGSIRPLALAGCSSIRSRDLG